MWQEEAVFPSKSSASRLPWGGDQCGRGNFSCLLFRPQLQRWRRAVRRRELWGSWEFILSRQKMDRDEVRWKFADAIRNGDFFLSCRSSHCDRVARTMAASSTSSASFFSCTLWKLNHVVCVVWTVGIEELLKEAQGAEGARLSLGPYPRFVQRNAAAFPVLQDLQPLLRLLPTETHW